MTVEDHAHEKVPEKQKTLIATAIAHAYCHVKESPVLNISQAYCCLLLLPSLFDTIFVQFFFV